MKKLFYVLPLIALFIYACKEDPIPTEPEPDALPAATESGANTIGCKINGDEIWLSKYGDTSNTNISLEATYDTAGGIFFITAVREDLTWGNFERIEIHGSSIMQDPLQDDISYYMTVEHDKVYGFYDFEPEDGCGHYFHDLGAPGNLNITYLDTVAQVISGTFDMVLVNNGCDPANLVITDGVFDVSYEQPE